MGLMRSILQEKNILLELWGEAISTCVYVLNRSLTKGIKGETPYEKWNGRKPNVSHLKVFGSIVFVKISGRQSKLKDKSKQRCLDPIIFKIHIRRDVIFVETKCYEFGEQSNMRKKSHSVTKTLFMS